MGLEQLRDAGLDGITISLHNLSEEKMEFLSGIPKALSKVLQALSTYAQVFGMQNGIHGINTVVSAQNIDEILYRNF